MDRRAFLLGTGACLGLFRFARLADADEPKEKKEKAEKPRQPVLPFVPGSWTLVILPDIQHYASYYPGLLRLQTRWIAQNKDKYKITYVLQNGDMTNRNSKPEWERVDRAFRILDGVVPYAIVPGNHDYIKCGKSDRITKINEYFPPSRFMSWPTFGGTMEKAALIAKKSLLRPIGQRHSRADVAKLEEEILEEVNKLGIGPQGFGGRVTALDVHIEIYPTHIGSIPLAVNIQCHSYRHKEAVI